MFDDLPNRTCQISPQKVSFNSFTCRIIFKLGNVDFEGKLVLTDFATKFWAIYFGSETKLHTNIHTKIRDIFIYFSHIGIITSFNT